MPWGNPVQTRLSIHDIVNQAADKYQIPRNVFRAMIRQQPNNDQENPVMNADKSAQYLRGLYHETGSWSKALARHGEDRKYAAKGHWGPPVSEATLASNPFADIIQQAQIGTDPASRRQAAMNYFQSQGYKPFQAAAIVGNLMHESAGTLNPKIKGDGGASIGIAQWNKERRAALKKFAARNRVSPDDFMTQLRFINHELETGESGAAKALRQSANLQEATNVFSKKYERPGHPAMASRMNYAVNALTDDQDPFADIAREAAAAQNIPPGTEDQSQPQKTLGQKIVEKIGPSLPAAGFAAGSVAGELLEPLGGGVPGAAIGYGLGEKAKEALETSTALREAESLPESLASSGRDLVTGAEQELLGMGGGKLLGKGLEYAGKLIRPVMGTMSGVGTLAIEKALSGAKGFLKALRGDITGEDIVAHAHQALSTITKQRNQEYLARLSEIRLNPTKLNAIRDELDKTLNSLIGERKFNIGISRDPETYQLNVDLSKSRIVKGADVVQRAIQEVKNWGDNSAAGLDSLKQRLGDYIKQAPKETPAKAFITQLQKTLDRELKANVPGYTEMVKPYAELTTLIKNIASNLMMRPEGISGRITADQTLRRLMSAMRDNFQLRGDLLDSLTRKSGQEIADEVAGHAMNDLLPRGIMRPISVVEGGFALAHYLNPSLWPLIAASSPRLQGEFLNLVGKYLGASRGMTLPVGKIISYLAFMRKQARPQKGDVFTSPARVADQNNGLPPIGG